MRPGLILVLCLALLSAACATNPATLDITPESRNGLILMYARPAPVDYQLDVLRFNEEGTALEANTFNGIYPFRPDAGEQGFIMKEAKPGRYVFVSLHQQGYWAVCFHNETVSFDVRPGEVTFLGVFDPVPHLAQLQNFARTSGQTTTRGGPVHFYDNVLAPRLSPPTDQTLATARTFMAQAAPNVTAPINAAQLGTAQFGNGRDVFGSTPMCGGYYAAPRETTAPAQ